VIRVAATVKTHAPAPAVFAYLSDPLNQREWTPNFLELEQAPTRPIGLGTRYRGRLRAFGWVTFVIDEFDAGRTFRVDTDPPVGRLTHRFTVDADGHGARVSHLVELEPRGPARFGAPLLRLLIKLMVLDLNRHMTKVLNREIPRAH
jgi:hypothetical protein